jgi:NAD(P)-dependent dehydrogenase (short-subunit alcohol dehydrogenase family)
MARVFITGSADGLGQLTAKSLVEKGHKVVLHARNYERGMSALEKVPGAENVLIGDLSNVSETIALAEKVNESGIFDVIIHNAGVYNASAQEIFYVNTLAPFILSSLIQKPKRLIYLSSGMHLQGFSKLECFKDDISRITYSDSKLHVLLLCKAIARRWPDVYSNAVDPGWVPTKMGGAAAPDNLQKGYETQVWLAAGTDAETNVTGKYFYHKSESPCNPEAGNILLQDQFLEVCREITGLKLSFDK